MTTSANGSGISMGLFRRNKTATVDLNERSEKLGLRVKDLLVLEQLVKAGADLTQPRHVVFYLYFPAADDAHAAASEAEGAGFANEVRDPSETSPDSWTLVADRHETVLSPEFVRDSDDLFQRLADTHHGEYDGWEASV